MSKPKCDVVSSEAEANDFQQLCNKFYGYPKRGTDIHGNPVGPETPGFGWTMRHDEVKAHNDGKRWAHAAPDIDDPKGDKTKLTAEERATMQAKHEAAVELDETWEGEQGNDQ
jgi:hypothetical protein